MAICVRSRKEAAQLRADGVRQRVDRPSQRRNSAETNGRQAVRASLADVTRAFGV
jgi:hypothetical protein